MQATHTLNIGLHISDRLCEELSIRKPAINVIDPQTVLRLLRDLCVWVHSCDVQQSDSEPTLVVRTDRLLSPEQVSAICYILRQEAIVQYSHIAEAGWVEGPMAENWGEFNPEYFLLIDGRRLSETEEA